MRLLLVRHAKAEERDPDRWPNDADRPLSVKGADRFSVAARRLRKVVMPDVLLTSPYARAVHTAALLETCAKWPKPVEEPWVPDGELSALVEEAFNNGVETLAIVGHEPTLSTFISTLVSGSSTATILMKPGSVALIELASATSGELQWLVTPKLLRSAAK